MPAIGRCDRGQTKSLSHGHDRRIDEADGRVPLQDLDAALRVGIPETFDRELPGGHRRQEPALGPRP